MFTTRLVSFQLGNAIPVNVIMFLPATVLGMLGGVFGATFTITHLKISRLRRRILTKLRKPCLQKIVRFVEPLLIMVCLFTSRFKPAYQYVDHCDI